MYKYGTLYAIPPLSSNPLKGVSPTVAKQLEKAVIKVSCLWYLAKQTPTPSNTFYSIIEWLVELWPLQSVKKTLIAINQLSGHNRSSIAVC